MRLRIALGESAPPPADEVNKLRTLHQSASLTVQGSDDVRILDLEDGRRALLAGRLIGMRTSSNGMSPCADASASLRDLVRVRSIESCREVLEGRYFLAILGPDDACSVCADRFGQLDLFYAPPTNPKVFASDLSLLDGSARSGGYDQVALAHALTVYGYRPGKRHTFYRGVRRLGIGETLRIERGRPEVLNTSFQPACTGDFGNRELNEYADLLLDAVRVRGSRNGNVVYLSSGWDSTSILACLVHLFGARKVRAVIGRLQPAHRSGVLNQFELDRAQAVAAYFGVRLDVVEFDQRTHGPEWAERLQPLFRSQHLASMPGINHAILADFVAQTTNGDEVVFAGEISDGAHNLGFAQFLTIFHPVNAFREYSDKMAGYLFGPTFLRLLQRGQFIDDPVYKLLRERAGSAVFDEAADGGPSARPLQLLASFFLRAHRLPLWSLRNSRMLTAAGAEAYSSEMESTYLKQAAERATPETLYAWYLHLYNSFHWQGATVATLPLTAEAKGLTMALPFWDTRVQEFLSAMPEDWGRGLDLRPTKYPLKWMLANRIPYPLHVQVGPHSYVYDVDPSFSLAAETMYASAFAPYFKGLLRPRAYHNLLAPETFNVTYIDDMVGRYLEGVEVRGAELNDLVSLSVLSMVDW
jgi:hypothetical protein